MVLVAQLPFAELLVRVLATALIIVLVAMAVGRMGPVAGGLVAGLPIGLGPGFFFLLDTESSAFLAEASTHSLLALSATQIFLTAYAATARYVAPIACVSFAAILWWCVVWGLRALPDSLLFAAILFASVTFCARLVGRRFLISDTTAKRPESLHLLLLRATLGGVLVALVTVFSSLLGAGLSGVLIAFPIGYALITLHVHAQYDAATAIGVAHSAVLGTISLATFCVVFCGGLRFLIPEEALVVSLVASIGTTGIMMFVAHVRENSRQAKS